MADVLCQSSGDAGDAGLTNPYYVTTPESRTLGAGSYAANCIHHYKLNESSSPVEDFGAGLDADLDSDNGTPDYQNDVVDGEYFIRFSGGESVQTSSTLVTTGSLTNISIEALYIQKAVQTNAGWGSNFPGYDLANPIALHNGGSAYFGSLDLLGQSGADGFSLGCHGYQAGIDWGYIGADTDGGNSFMIGDVVHLMHTFDTGVHKFYVNGVLIGTVDNSGSYTEWGHSVNNAYNAVGGHDSRFVSSYYVNGSVAHAAMWNITLDPSDFISGSGTPIPVFMHHYTKNLGG